MYRIKDKWISVAAILTICVLLGVSVFAQNGVVNENLAPTPFRIGERLTYSVSFERYTDVAFAEIAVVSRGRLGDRDAVELRSKIKTYDILNAAFYSLDESRVVVAAAESGLPLYVTKTQNNPVSPKESVTDYLNTPAVNLDLLTLIYKVRNAGAVGTFSFFENDHLYTISFVPGQQESVRSGAGHYDTTLTGIESDFLKENGLSEVKINFTNDSDHIPVLIRFRTGKGKFRVELSSSQFKEPKVIEPQAAPTPAPVPRMSPTPRSTPTPIPYVENQPLSEELTFQLGETLDYRVTVAGRPVGTIRLKAVERKQIRNRDTLVLSAEVISAEAGNPLLSMRDSMVAFVSPETLTPYQFEIKSAGPLNYLNTSVLFEQGTGIITSGTASVDAPIGTHSLLSLVYALRSFNLKRSGDRNNPVNDTRVSVYWNGKPYVFSLRPSDAELIDIRGQKVSSQMIAVTSNDPQFDPRLKIWLSNDGRRLPLRFTVGTYQADLFAQTTAH
jgi:Protein of unknown function (DUF3108)